MFFSYGQEVKIESLNISGTKRLKNSFVARITCAKEDDKLDSVVLQEDVRLLKWLPAVANAQYEVVYLNDSVCTVTYKIQENITIIPSFNVYTTTNSEVAYRIGLAEYNLFGRNIVLGGFYQKNVYDSYGATFKAPYLFSKKAGISLNYQNITTLEPIFFDSGTSNFKYNNESIELLGNYFVNGKNKIELGVNFFTESYQHIVDDSGVIPPVGSGEIVKDKLLYKGIYEYSNVEYFYYLVSGFRNVFNFQYVQNIGNYNEPKFIMGWNDLLFYKIIGQRGNWANRVRIGFSSNEKSPFAPFSVDNNVNIRGVGNIIDRGTGSIVVNTEYRYTLFENNAFAFQSNVFVDAGSWRKPGGDYSDFIEDNNLRVYSGLGVRFISKKIFSATFRIDYGFGLTEKSNGLVLGIGQYF